MIRYIVRCQFTDAAVAQQWVDWLLDGHIAEVCAGGALTGVLCRPVGQGLQYEVHYDFPSRTVFDRYEADVAPGLRDAGLQKFPLELGLSYSRSVLSLVS